MGLLWIVRALSAWLFRVAHAIGTVFAKFAELGSARQVFLWWRSQGLKYPVRRIELRTHPVVWLTPSYGMVLRTLHNPIYAGAYVFGKSETVRRLGGEDAQTIQVRRVKRSEWPVVIRDHHPAYLSFAQFLENQGRMRNNAAMTHAGQGESSGTVREGPGVLQGLVRCGRCGRKMHLSYGEHRSQRVYQYRCAHARAQQGGTDCQLVGGKRIDQTVVAVFLEATASRSSAGMVVPRRRRSFASGPGSQPVAYWIASSARCSASALP